MFPNPETINVRKSATILTAYNGTPIPQRGKVKLDVSHNGNRWYKETFYIAETTGPAILGLPSSLKLKLITVHCAINQAPIKDVKDVMRLYPEQFDKIGKFDGEHHIVIDQEIPPVIHAPGKCPIHLKDELKNELDKMLVNDVIRKVTEPTDWVNSLTYSRKANGEIRICLDPKDLNKAIKRNHHKTPTLEELTHKFREAKFFSKLDAIAGTGQ